MCFITSKAPDFLEIHTTFSAVPCPPINVRGLSTVVVWQPPEQPKGVITGYDIQFFRGSQSEDPIPKGSNELFHVVVNSNIPPGTNQDVTVRVSTPVLIITANIYGKEVKIDSHMQVRAKNSRHNGTWSSRVEVGEYVQTVNKLL